LGSAVKVADLVVGASAETLDEEQDDTVEEEDDEKDSEEFG
jgi:hypothetical protein